MKISNPWLCLVAVTCLFAFNAACNDDDDDDNDSPGVDDDDAGECTIETLCEESMALDCEGGWSNVDECIDEWEGAIEECEDPDGLLDCNCDCLVGNDCDEMELCSVDCTLTYCL
jgi:hypothetical protein